MQEAKIIRLCEFTYPIYISYSLSQERIQSVSLPYKQKTHCFCWIEAEFKDNTVRSHQNTISQNTQYSNQIWIRHQ